MSLRYWSPFDEFRRLESEISNLFKNWRTEQLTEGYTPLAIDFHETSDQYMIVADVPGFTKDDITIEANPQYLEIRVESDESEVEENWNTIIRERSMGKYIRRVNFDKPIEANQAQTHLRDGVLIITMPKAEEAKSIKLIPEEN